MVKGANAFGDFDKALELVALDNFFKVPEAMKLWILGRSKVETVQAAADLADECTSRRGREETCHKLSDSGTAEQQGKGADRDARVESDLQARMPAMDSQKSDAEHYKANSDDRLRRRTFEKRQPVMCYNCNKTGHIEPGCRKPKILLAYTSEPADPDELLGRHVFHFDVNGKGCRFRRDSGATGDVVDRVYVSSEDFNGKRVWVKPVLAERSVWLPLANVRIRGPFGEPRAEAAVSRKLPPSYPTC